MRQLGVSSAIFLLLVGIFSIVRAQPAPPKRDLTDTTWEETGYSTVNKLAGDPTMEQFGIPTRRVLTFAACEADKPCHAKLQVIRVETNELIRELPMEGTYDGTNVVLVLTVKKADYGYDGTETMRLALIEEKDQPTRLKGNSDSVIVGSTTAPSPPRDVVFEGDLRLPVIFLPGVAGTVLTSDRLEVWPLAPAGTRANLGLEPDGITRAGTGEIGVGPILRSGAVNFYGTFLEALTQILKYKEGEDLFAFGYDWRLSNDAHYAALDKLIDTALEKSKKKKVILVAHSMGGVIARGYIYASAKNAGKVASLITMGTPYWGAPKVYYGVTSGYQFGNPFVRKELMKVLLQNCPSAYQLLPQSAFITDKTTGQKISLDVANTIKYKWFTEVKWGVEDKYDPTSDNVLVFNPKLMDKARGFFAAVGTREAPRPLPAGVRQYAIIGTGVSTVVGFEMEDWSPGFLDSIMGWKTYLEVGGRKVVMHPRIGDGDGTVPLWSLETAASTANYYVPHKSDASSAHGDLPANPTVLVIALSIIKNNPVKPQDYPRPPTYMDDPTTRGTEVEDNTQFELHSDAHLRITNQAGKALGFNSDGGIDESLPGTFLSYEGVEFASVSDLAAPLKVTVDGIRTGKFTLNVKTSGGGKPAGEFMYKEVPVTAGTKTEFTFIPSTATVAPDLQVTDGAGKTIVKPVVIQQLSPFSTGTGRIGGVVSPPTAGAFLGTIPSANGTVTGLKVFENNAEELPPIGLRPYKTRFNAATLKAVYFEFSVKYAVENSANFAMSVIWKKNGELITRQELSVAKPSGLATSTKTYGYIPPTGKWDPGNYTIDVEVDGRKVASAVFTIE